MTTEPLLLSTLNDTDDEHDEQNDLEQQRRPTPLAMKRRRHIELDNDYNDNKPAGRRRVQQFLCHPLAIFTLSVAIVVLLICLWIHRTPRLPTVSSPDLRPEPTSHFFVFGDSYSKTQFNSRGALPSEANPIGNPPLRDIGKVTTSGGPNWATILTTRHNDTLTYLYNYAFGGATINKRVIPPPHNLKVQDFTDQISLFKATLGRADAPTPADRRRALFAIWFGQNDVDQVYNRTVAHPNATVERALDSYISSVIELWNEGARTFLFIGASPIMLSPLVAAEQDAERVARLVGMFNERMRARVEGFAEQYEGLRVHYYDPAPAFARVLERPKGYGLVNATCVFHDGVSCPWWDHFHPGVRIHEQVAADVAKLDISLFEPLDPAPTPDGVRQD